ncbi:MULTISPECIES: hypothetical protein [unclassified Lysobacter]|uniref:hypothetical protein n=1 Tax=unclassified Lysobacter TaxID=2635362 RepID=UPI001BE5834B|nr:MULTISPECIES: hypothetical protein [unclassified Lysobacter]MBT2748248.1 hypothetical protein [Lysobacter sp. ISL-42]MBT2749985.1 hypothetical protein [Lysobacter sp. ISL-50]MBT2781313.1 hypothetical protein [Lysobacter sp. ISL-52]
MSSKLWYLTAGLLSSLAFVYAAPAAAQMINLDTLGGNVCTAENTNNSGAIIGTCREVDGDIVAVYWAPGSATPVPLPPLEVGGPCEVYDINNANVAAGNCEQGATGEWFPVRWVTSLPGSGPQRLNPLAGHAKAEAWLINHAGVVAGASIEAGGGSRAVVWRAGQSGPTNLPELGLLPPLLPSSTECQVADLSESAEAIVVGTCELRDGGSVAVRWAPGLFGGYAATELPRLPGGSNCAAAAINNNSFVAGTCEDEDGDIVAVRWAPNGTSLTYLDYLEASGESRQQLAVVDMNEAGVIVGNYITDEGFDRAFAWVPNGNPMLEEGLDLGSLGGAWARAIDIADNGHVVGVAQNTGGHSHAFRWTPTDEIADLGSLGGFTSQAAALSDNGLWQVGTSQTTSGHVHAYTLDPTRRARARFVALSDAQRGGAVKARWATGGWQGGVWNGRMTLPRKASVAK